MKRSLQLPLAIALALSAANASALGLGPVHVNSRLNQPLDAEIPVLQGTVGEAEGLLVNLAGAEDFERVGLNRSRLTVPLDFAVTKNNRGEVFIKITSKEPVRDTFLDVLVEANWPKGRLLREYAILLDPPVSAPATARSAPAASNPNAPGSVTLIRREPRAERSTAAAPAPTPAPRQKPVPAAAEPARKASGGEYGPVEAGETLSAIARAEAGSGVSHNQMMLALLKHNPNAFYRNNINALKRGAILRIPSAAEAKAIGSASEAATQAQAQIEDWRGGRASPTLVADAGTPAAAPAAADKSKSAAPKTAAAGKSPSERLELVPPKAGKDSLAMADRPGSGGGSPALTEIKAELARTKEALTARSQETGELKSRVQELEDMKGKNDRLISLKDSEIAELQRKLKEMQDPASKNAAAKPATPAPAANAPVAAAKPTDSSKAPPSKDEIWGNADATAGAKPATDPAKPAADAAKPAAAAAATSTTTVPLAETPATTNATPAASTPAPAPAATTGTPAPTASTPTSSTAAPAPTDAAPTSPPAAAAPKPAAAAATPKTDTKPKIKPVAAAPWYEEPWVLPAALGGGLVLLLAALFGLRKRKPAATPERGSIASAFGDSPLSSAGAASADSVYDTEENSLREQIARDPHNLGLRLELLSIHYAERATDKFEAAAAEMHGYVTDPTQPEWQEALAMGQEIAPRNPLFATAQHGVIDDEIELPSEPVSAPVPPAHGYTSPSRYEDDFAADFEPTVEPPKPVAPADARLGFGLDDDTFETHPSTQPAKADKLDSGFEFDLPPLDFDPPAKPVAAAAEPIEDDYFGGEDAVGTKLDLAKAYMDMGDPEGARSMLDEVIAEGNAAQKAEAQRLLAEVR